ncbi:PTS fructose transporter subunit IIB [Isobaculum melis]|uniref:PTS system IIB component, Fru family n=1 Tax=Isobaculum melis TaxID=142588 RepID=A0A1H9TQN6_9LACT|nr:fructose PTS transporter subunit IIB [Isobaculum melis]SER99319.1 PTS system IIB component, Fru family [Isobaculum melis]
MTKKIIGVAACPAGIAHTYLVAEAIENAAKKLGFECKVETQGSIGIEDRLTAEEIENADLIVFSVGVAVRDNERFEGYEEKSIKVPLHQTIESIDQIMADYFNK